MSQELVPVSPESSNPQWNVYGLAQLGAEQQLQAYTATYAALRDKLNGADTDSTTFATVQAQESAERRNNLSIISSFCGYLPCAHPQPSVQLDTDTPTYWQYSKDDNYFRVKDVFTLRSIQASILWQPGPYMGIDTAVDYGAEQTQPWYIVGERQAPANKDYSELLLASFGHKIGALTVKARFAKECLELMESTLENAPSEKGLKEMYDSIRGDYVVGINSEGSFAFDTSNLLHRQAIRGIKSLRKYRTLLAKDFDDPYNSGPTDREMAEFAVYERLGQLAALFNVTEKYKKLLAWNIPAEHIVGTNAAPSELQGSSEPTGYNLS